jgi:hypothetical protein
MLHAAQQQAGAYEKYNGEGDFRNDQGAASEMAASGSAA